MLVDVGQTLRQALTTLQHEKQQIERQIAAVETATNSLNAGGMRPNPRRGQSPNARKRRRRRMTPAARRAASRRMKAYWAKRKGSSKASHQK